MSAASIIKRIMTVSTCRFICSVKHYTHKSKHKNECRLKNNNMLQTIRRCYARSTVAAPFIGGHTMNEYKECIDCGEEMHGIMDYGAREMCEECGGNTTEYDIDNPLEENLG